MTLQLVITNGKEINMSKQPLSTQLLVEQNKSVELATEIAVLKTKIVDLEKKAENEKNSTANHRDSAKKAEAEIEQIHQMLDSVPNPIARKSEGEASWDIVTRSSMTRLAAWLASRSH